jgi:hypothetical protein
VELEGVGQVVPPPLLDVLLLDVLLLDVLLLDVWPLLLLDVWPLLLDVLPLVDVLPVLVLPPLELLLCESVLPPPRPTPAPGSHSEGSLPPAVHAGIAEAAPSTRRRRRSNLSFCLSIHAPTSLKPNGCIRIAARPPSANDRVGSTGPTRRDPDTSARWPSGKCATGRERSDSVGQAPGASA